MGGGGKARSRFLHCGGKWAASDRDHRLFFVQGPQEAVKGGREEKGEQNLGDEVSGEEEDAGRGKDCQAGVESGAGVEGTVGPKIAEEREEEDSDGLWEMGGEGVEAEEAEAESDDPVRERGFFEVADAVDLEGNEVAGEGHVAGGAGVGAVGVVEQRRSEEGGEEDDQPETAEDGQSGRAARGAGVERCRTFCGGFKEDLVDHEFLVLS